LSQSVDRWRPASEDRPVLPHRRGRRDRSVRWRGWDGSREGGPGRENL